MNLVKNLCSGNEIPYTFSRGENQIILNSKNTENVCVALTFDEI